jgi:multidrug resistance efflux pump
LRARLSSADADLALTQKEYERIRTLTEEGAVPQRQLDTATAALRQAEARRQDVAEALARAEKGTPPEELAQAREAFRQAQAQLALVQEGARREDVQSARHAMEAAAENLRLVRRGPRNEDISAAKARLDQTKAALAELEKGSRPEDIAKAKAARNQAAHQAQSVKANLEERNVFAPTDAVIERILVADGDVVAAGTPVAQLSTPSDIWLRVYLPEADLSKVKVGDSAELRIDGIAGSVEAVVESIANKGEFTPANLQSPEERGKQVFAVRLRLRKPDSRVKAGMFATVKQVGRWP